MFFRYRVFKRESYYPSLKRGIIYARLRGALGFAPGADDGLAYASIPDIRYGNASFAPPPLEISF